MTQDELIDAIRGRLKSRDRDDFDAGFRAGIEAAAELAEQLDTPPAMAWQECVLDKLRASRDAYLRDDEYDTFERELIESVMGEAIAVVRHSIPAPPPLPKRGDK